MEIVFERLCCVGTRNSADWRDYESAVEKFNSEFEKEKISAEVVDTSVDKGYIVIHLDDDELKEYGIESYLDALNRLREILYSL